MICTQVLRLHQPKSFESVFYTFSQKKLTLGKIASPLARGFRQLSERFLPIPHFDVLSAFPLRKPEWAKEEVTRNRHFQSNAHLHFHLLTTHFSSQGPKVIGQVRDFRFKALRFRTLCFKLIVLARDSKKGRKFNEDELDRA